MKSGRALIAASLAGSLRALEIRMVAQDHYKVTACRESENTDTMWIEVPFGGMRAG